MNLQDATQIAPAEPGFSAMIAEDWCIWGPIGGYIAAIALRAAGMAAPQGHRPVTFSCQFLSRAAAGSIDIDVEPLKTGSTAFFNVRLLQNSVCFLQAQVCTTAKTDGPDDMGVTAPDVPRPDELESFADMLKRLGHKPPDFWTNVDGRQVDARPPGDPDPRGCRSECWMRFADWQETADPFLEAARALVLIDVSIWRAYNRGQSELPRHVAPSLDLTVWFHDAVPASSWQLIEANADVARHALLCGSGHVWSEDGRLVASGGGQCLFVPLK